VRHIPHRQWNVDFLLLVCISSSTVGVLGGLSQFSASYIRNGSNGLTIILVARGGESGGYLVVHKVSTLSRVKCCLNHEPFAVLKFSFADSLLLNHHILCWQNGIL